MPGKKNVIFGGLRLWGDIMVSLTLKQHFDTALTLERNQNAQEYDFLKMQKISFLFSFMVTDVF